MSGSVNSYTTNFKFKKINFNVAPWHDLEWSNWSLLDAVLFTYMNVSNVQGVWGTGTAYTVGQRVVDDAVGQIYECEVNHTSAASGTFAADRAANPTYWRLLGIVPKNRGTWATGVLYSENDYVQNGHVYAVCITNHTSGATFAGDSAKWIYLIDATGSVNAAATSAANAATSATNAGVSATASSASAAAALVSANNAAAIAAQNFGLAFNATSASSNTIGTGALTFVTQASKAFQAGQYVIISDQANSANFVHGTVTSYSGTTLIINATDTGGSGTKTAWNIGLSAPQGTQGATGLIASVAGGGTANAITASIASASTTDLTTVAVRCPSGVNTTTTPTFKLNSDIAYTITARGGRALVLGDIGAANFVAILSYRSSTTSWELLNPAQVDPNTMNLIYAGLVM